MTTTSDPFAHFHDLQRGDTQQFARDAHAETLKHFDSAPFHTLSEDILKQLQNDKQIPFCQEHRAKMYHFHQSSEYPKGVYRVCRADTYRAGMPDWQILFQVADFDAILGDSVYLSGVSHYVEQPERVLLTLSADGADAAYTVEFDLAERRIVPGGFHFPLGKNHIAWRDADSVWVCPAWDERQQTASGYPCEVWLLERGKSFEDAVPVYRMESTGMMVNAWRYLDGMGKPIDLIEAAEGFYTNRYFYVDAGLVPHPLPLPSDSEIVGYLAGQLLVKLPSGWQRANHCYPEGALVAVKLNKGTLGQAECLFAPDERQAVAEVETTRHFVLLHYLDNVQSCLKAWHYAQGAWQEAELPPLPSGSIELTDQPWGGDVIYFAAGHFTTPLTLYALDLQVMELTVLRRQPAQFASDSLTVQQFHAQSADGTAIPYFHIGGTPAPDTPTIVYAYGGFGVAERPYYLNIIGRHWLAAGGAFVVANIRGGGEFRHWHHAARKQHKHRSVDDLLAVINDLHQRGLSSPQHTALQGGSNGGLITAAAFVRAPERIGALVCEVPLTDMLAYAELSAGASWTDEYGDPADPQMRPFLQALSPYHHLGEQPNYPPALITTARQDDRVHPAHALKFYAKLRALNAPAWLYAPEHGGHSDSGTQAADAEETALILCFLKQIIGRHHD